MTEMFRLSSRCELPKLLLPLLTIHWLTSQRLFGRLVYLITEADNIS